MQLMRSGKYVAWLYVCTYVLVLVDLRVKGKSEDSKEREREGRSG